MRSKIIDLGQSCPIGTTKSRIQGTPDYIAPEQVKRRTLGPRTDVFNLGATMYWALTGKNVPTLIPKKIATVARYESQKCLRSARTQAANPGRRVQARHGLREAGPRRAARQYDGSHIETRSVDPQHLRWKDKSESKCLKQPSICSIEGFRPTRPTSSDVAILSICRPGARRSSVAISTGTAGTWSVSSPAPISPATRTDTSSCRKSSTAGPRTHAGGCLSYQLLFKAVQWKLDYPDIVRPSP